MRTESPTHARRPKCHVLNQPFSSGCMVKTSHVAHMSPNVRFASSFLALMPSQMRRASRLSNRGLSKYVCRRSVLTMTN